MLNKSLSKILVILIIGTSISACGQNDYPNSSTKAEPKLFETQVNINTIENEKKINDQKWLEFQNGFKKKDNATEMASEIAKDIILKTQRDSKLKTGRKISLSEHINIKKWEAFQKAFRKRSKIYLKTVVDAFTI